MNIVCIDNNYSPGARPELGPQWYLLSHSCLHRDLKPLYLPDWDADFRLFPSVAIRIDRLGKGIPARFASRYWDHWTFGFSLRATATMHTLNEAPAPLPYGRALAFDDSTIPGPWMEASDKDLLCGAHFEVTATAKDGSPQASVQWSMQHLRLSADRCIEAISRFLTLKTGDIIFLGFPSDGLPIDRDVRISVKASPSGIAAANSDSLMSFYIKTPPGVKSCS